jgi:hypothetical protein
MGTTMKFKSHLSLSESTLTFGNITRLGYEYRVDLFINKMKMGEPFELVNGETVVIKYDKDIEQALKSGNKKSISSKPLSTLNGEKFSFSKLSKSTEFGGGKRGSGGGSDSTRATESAQCVYAQLYWDNPKTKFSPDELSATYAKVHVDATIDEVLLNDEQWITSSQNAARLLYKGLNKKTYTWHRGSSWVSALESKFNSLNRQEKLFSNINKWSPADIWAVATGTESTYKILDAMSISELNNELMKAFAARDIIGISLKKIGSKAKLKQVNYKKPFNPPTFTKQTFGKRNFYGAKDGYIMGSGGFEIQFRTFPAFQCEIIGKKAKHGKVSYGGISDAMKMVVGRPLISKKEVEALYRKGEETFFNNFYELYKKTDEIDKKEVMIKNLKGKKVDWLVSKYMVMELFTAIKGREQQVLDLLVRIAKSETKDSAPFLKVM